MEYWYERKLGPYGRSLINFISSIHFNLGGGEICDDQKVGEKNKNDI